MTHITLRVKTGISSPGDISVTVQDNTYEYLMTAEVQTIRVSAYLDQDLPRVEASYAELFVESDCPYLNRVNRITPGSKTRKGIQLPAAMTQGEQLVIEVARTSVS